MTTVTTYPNDYLVRYAYDKIWCAPEQDNQRVFNPERISGNEGVWGNFLNGWKRYDLPTKSERYHVYHVGQVVPSLIGLLDKQRSWFSMRYLCEQLNAFCDVFVDKGIIFPRSQCYYMVTDEKLLVLAVKIPDKNLINVDFVNERIYMRIYRNVFYNVPGANQTGFSIECQSKQSLSNQDILDMQNRITFLSQRPGRVISYVNGRIVDKVNLINAIPGDYIDFIYDPSIKQTLTFKVDSLYEFLSELDEINKYLLHNPAGSDVLDYQDDIDVYVINGQSTGNFQGLFFNKNNVGRFRNATHRDYTISSQGISNLYNHFRTPITHDKAYVQLFIRNAATNRSLINEANRIKDLYRMNDTDVYRAMVGIDSTVSVWNVANLEKANYVKLMRETYGTIEINDSLNALGYNAASVVTGDTPHRVQLTSGQKLIDIPVGLMDGCTAYEYDSDGLLLGWYYHTNNQVHVAQNPTCDLVELVFGEGTTYFDDIEGQSVTLLDRSVNHRFYLSSKISGIGQNDWQDVSGSSYYHVYDEGELVWAVNSSQELQLVRSNKNHLVYQIEDLMADGNLQFNISAWNQTRSQWETVKIPPARIDLFLNGHSLIEGVDYVIHWPSVYVFNKEYLNEPGQNVQKIVIRGTGFCTNEMKRVEAGDVGFVRHGVLSENNTYDIRDDKVNRVIVGGALYRYDELLYAETDGTVRVVDELNGKPYLISDILVPVNDFSASAISDVDLTLRMRDEARVIDKTISDYLTIKIPQREISTPSTIVRKYRIFSPFFSKLFQALDDGSISGDWMTDHYNEQKVKQVCTPYEYILPWDPISEVNTLDPTFVEIHPHPYDRLLTLTPYHYKFINMAVKVYAKNKINLSSHAVISLD